MLTEVGSVPEDIFEAGRVEILEVTPFDTASTTIWSCTRCAWHHSANESWTVRVRNRDREAERSLVVCPNCARDLRERVG